MTSSRPDTDDYLGLFLRDVPLMDTRAPVEFEKGAMPGAVNRPLMNDEERARVGTCYKEHGQAAAIALGHELVSGRVKKQRIEAWLQFARRHPEGYLYCFRGGMRSAICQQWMREAGVDYPRITGGYKAMRSYLLEQLERLSAEQSLVILAGHTGAAKTVVLNERDNAIDLEGLANHRGSAFGNRVAGQPSQIDFENHLAVALLKQHHRHPGGVVLLEDESRLIGRRSLPRALREAMDRAPVVVLEVPLEDRVSHSFNNYILDKLNEWQSVCESSEGFDRFAEDLRDSLRRVRRRLGGERYQELSAVLDDALAHHERTGDPSRHRDWIRPLLNDYYDPMYEYQISHKKNRVIFSGSNEEVRQYLDHLH
ncbi:MAG: tRNA 2-selenouridine(34) synthase MnmH [Pseudohongiellaceae bacterium]